MPSSRPPYPTAVLLLAAGALLACAPQAAPPAGAPAVAVAGGARGVVERMRAQHAGGWYETLQFRQRNTAYTAAGEARDAGEWLERQRVPGRLRIDFVAPQANGSGILFRSDSQYVFDGGRLDQQMPLLHPLLLLSADAYALPVDSTMQALARLGLDTALVRDDAWQGRPVHVVGAAAGDSTSSQFWVDRERLLLVRLLHAQTAADGRRVTTDYHLTYQDVGGFPVPHEIVFHRNGRPYFRETYVDVRANVPVDAALFDPAQWAQGVPGR